MPRYFAMRSVPGYTPIMPTQEFATFNEARDYVADAIQELADDFLLKALSTDTVTPADTIAVNMGNVVNFVRRKREPFEINVSPGLLYSVAKSDWDFVEARIGSHFLSYLINGDSSGIEDSEAKQLDAFCAGIQEGRTGGHWSDHDTEDFARCEVTDLMNQCVNVRYNFKEQAK